MQRGKTFWAVLAILGAGVGLYGNCAGLFLLPMAADLGANREAVSLVLTIHTLTAGLTLPLYGKLLRRFGTRPMLLVSAGICTGVLFAESIAGRVELLWLLAVMSGFFSNGLTLGTLGILLRAAYPQAGNRPAAECFAVTTLTAASVLPLLRWILEYGGWRWGLRSLGLLGGIVLFPAILLGISRQSTPLVCHSGKLPHQFWGIALFVFITHAGNAAVFQQGIPLLLDRGIPLTAAVHCQTAALLLMAALRLRWGGWLDRFGVNFANFVLTGGVGAALLLGGILTVRPIPPFVWAIALGAAGLAHSVPVGFLVGRCCPPEQFAGVSLRMMGVAAVGTAVGSPFAAAVFTYTGSYLPAFLLLGFLLATASGALWFIFR